MDRIHLTLTYKHNGVHYLSRQPVFNSVLFLRAKFAGDAIDR